MEKKVICAAYGVKGELEAGTLGKKAQKGCKRGKDGKWDLWEAMLGTMQNRLEGRVLEAG